jgi:hypothetical protein
MSLLGKILAILNVLAALGIVALIALDYGQRQRWAYAVYLHDLRIEGLPFDDQEKGTDGLARVEKLTPGVLTDVFQGSGQPVRTQLEEVDRVRNLLQQKIEAGDGGVTKEQKLARILMPLAATYEEREALRRRWAGEKDNKAKDDKFLGNLEERFNNLFAQVRNPARPPDERKRDAAHLLFGTAEVVAEDQAGGINFNPAGLIAEPSLTAAYLDGAPARRAALVTGLAAAARAVDDEALVLEKMIRPATAALDEDRNLFLAQYTRELYTLQDMANRLQEQTQFKNAKADEAAKMESLVQGRRLLIQQLEQQLKETQKATQDKLDRQAGREKEIFAKLKAVRDTARKNQELEKEIRGLEGVTDKDKKGK